MRKVTLAGGVLGLSLMGLTNAYAGPCSDDIAALSRQLGQMPGLGAPISEPSAGMSVGAKSVENASASVPKPSDRAQPGGASREGGGSPGTVAGVAGSAVGSGASVASGQIATSDQDVRAQSVGKPSAAQQAATKTGSASTAQDDRVSEAKMSLQKAVDLNARGDTGCASAVSRTRELMKPS